MTSSDVCEALYKITSDKTQALQRGLKDRQRIADALDRGEDPIGHRVDWLRNTAYELNDTLMACAKDFNDRYPGDCISVSDMVDALATLMQSYRKNSK